MKTVVRQRALELGFDDCRFTPATAPETGPYFQRWLDEGEHGRMDYLSRSAHKRLDPQKVLPGAKTIITLAASYESKTFYPRESPPPGTGLIARYARYVDYHKIFRAPLSDLTNFIDTLGGVGTKSLWYVDTGPLLERDLAQRAGLGFVGKHTNLISRKLGNWIFLAEIITTLELEPDAPEKNRCGSCQRCLDACPTRAITAPFRLDARRCISYLTIELRGSIPLEFRSAIGNRIYGCDDCLEVCPWNRFAREGRLLQGQIRTDVAEPELIGLLALDEEGFKRRFSGTPMMRAKRAGLVRNACVALGNVGGAAAWTALQRVANGADPVIAEHARWAIDQITSRQSTNPSPGQPSTLRHSTDSGDP